jgi:hypothetical protein
MGGYVLVAFIFSGNNGSGNARPTQKVCGETRKMNALVDTEFMSKSTLKNRGWTDKSIESFLKNADKTANNPYYKSASTMKLYLTSRVLATEKSKEYITFQTISNQRKAASVKAAQTKKKQLLQRINACKIELEQRSPLEVRQDAIIAYNDFKEQMLWEREHEYTPATENSDAEFLNRITVNYLRHSLSNYDDQLGDIFGRVGVGDAYTILNEKIYAKIAETYPHLREETEKQLKRKLHNNDATHL